MANKEDKEYYAIIPARYESKRFPGKPLALIQGRPMFWHVYVRTCECFFFQGVWVATDDSRIYEEARRLHVPVVMTAKEHSSGTDRILEAARTLDLPPKCVIANVQGDEPTIHPEMLTQLLRPFRENKEVQTSTLCRRITPEEAQDPNIVKVVRSNSGRALYFSRSSIPYSARDEQEEYLGHIGLYAYTYKTLQQFSALGPSSLEKTEKLEQLRLLQSDIHIRATITECSCTGVDRPEDIHKIEKILQEKE